MSLTTVIILNAVLDLAVITGLALVMRSPFLFDRHTADVVTLQKEPPLDLAA